MNKEQKIKVMLLVGILIVSSFVLGYWYSIAHNTSKLEQKFINNIASYTDGVKDGIITDLSSYIAECIPNNPEMFVWVSLDKVRRGIIVKCGNITYPLKYSNEYFERLRR